MDIGDPNTPKSDDDNVPPGIDAELSKLLNDSTVDMQKAARLITAAGLLYQSITGSLVLANGFDNQTIYSKEVDNIIAVVQQLYDKHSVAESDVVLVDSFTAIRVLLAAAWRFNVALQEGLNRTYNPKSEKSTEDPIDI